MQVKSQMIINQQRGWNWGNVNLLDHVVQYNKRSPMKDWQVITGANVANQIIHLTLIMTSTQNDPLETILWPKKEETNLQKQILICIQGTGTMLVPVRHRRRVSWLPGRLSGTVNSSGACWRRSRGAGPHGRPWREWESGEARMLRLLYAGRSIPLPARWLVVEMDLTKYKIQTNKHAKCGRN